MKLVFIHGLPGVGKLTVAREVAGLTGFKVFHNHLTVDLVQSLFAFGSPPFVELRETIWLAALSQAVEAGLDGLIFTFAFERTVREGFIENVRTVVEANGGEVLFVELKCSTEELERRIVRPSRKIFGKLSSVEQFRELRNAGAFANPGIPTQSLVLDTTEISASETARLIVNSLRLN